MRIRLAALCLGAILLAGCDPGYPEPTSTGLPQDTDSAAMHGVYVGTGLFSNEDAVVVGNPVAITLRITDIGEDYVRITLALRSDLAAYMPHYRIEGEVRGRTCLFHEYEDQFKFWSNMVRTQDTVTGTVGVTDLDGNDIWYLNAVTAVR